MDPRVLIELALETDAHPAADRWQRTVRPPETNLSSNQHPRSALPAAAAGTLDAPVNQRAAFNPQPTDAAQRLCFLALRNLGQSRITVYRSSQETSPLTVLDREELDWLVLYPPVGTLYVQAAGSTGQLYWFACAGNQP